VGVCYVKHSAVRSGENQARLTIELADVASALHKNLPADCELSAKSVKFYCTWANRLVSEGSTKYAEKVALAARRGSPADVTSELAKLSLTSVSKVRNHLYPQRGTNDTKPKSPAVRVATFVKGLELKPNTLAKALIKGLDKGQLAALKAELAKVKA
jgi:hypothetical protein